MRAPISVGPFHTKVKQDDPGGISCSNSNLGDFANAFSRRYNMTRPLATSSPSWELMVSHYLFELRYCVCLLSANASFTAAEPKRRVEWKWVIFRIP